MAAARAGGASSPRGAATAGIRRVFILFPARRSNVRLALLRLRVAVGRRHIMRRHDPQGVYPAPVGPRDAELETVDARGLPAPGQPPELLHEQSRHGLEAFLLREAGAEVLVEFLDARHPADQEEALGLLADVLVVLDVELVVDLADDLLEDVLDRHQAGNAAVLVDHDGHVVAAAAELNHDG